MNRVRTVTFKLLAASIVLSSCFAAKTFAQTPSPTPTPAAAPQNPFAPQPAPPLPEGMTGADPNDPRANLKPGVYDIFFSFPIFTPVATKVKVEAGKTLDFDTTLKLDRLTNTVPVQVR